MCLGGVARRSASGALWPSAERQLLDDGKLLIIALRSEPQLDLHLNHPWRDITPVAGSQDSSWRLFEAKNPAIRCGGVRTRIVRNSKIRVIEEVEELETNPEHRTLPMREVGVFHDSEVSVEVAWPAKMISSLCERYGGATTRA